MSTMAWGGVPRCIQGRGEVFLDVYKVVGVLLDVYKDVVGVARCLQGRGEMLLDVYKDVGRCC